MIEIPEVDCEVFVMKACRGIALPEIMDFTFRNIPAIQKRMFLELYQSFTKESSM